MGQPGGVPYPPPGASSNMANVARSRGIRQIVIGAVIFVIGLIITIATYSAASSSTTGGTYFVAYGPMIIGVISMIRGGIAVAQAQKLR
jgi:predicted phage tail protein